MSSVNAASATANLLIEECTAKNTKVTSGGSTLATQNVGSNVSLYPASLAKATGIKGDNTESNAEWYVVSSWNTDVKADGYRLPSITKPTSGNGAGSWKLDSDSSTTYNAYALASYTLYTENGSVDVYLDNATERAIIVEDTGAKADSKVALKAMRIGIAVDGVMKLVYAPYAETSAGGNDSAYSGSSAYKSVSSATATGDALYTVTAGTDGAMIEGDVKDAANNVYSATKNPDGSFTAPASKGVALATGVSSTGVLVEIYVWLEGTDTECLTELIAGDDDVYKISVNFAGVKSTTSA